MNEAPYSLTQFIEDAKTLIGRFSDESRILASIEPLARRFAQSESWLTSSMYEADPVVGYGTTQLHVEPDQSLFIVVDSWLPGRGVLPHDHDTWAVVVGLEGVERNLFWERLDDRSRPGHAVLRALKECFVRPGQVLSMPSDAIHSVSNETRQTSLSLHIYGRHLNITCRRQYDVDHQRELPFLITPR